MTERNASVRIEPGTMRIRPTAHNGSRHIREASLRGRLRSVERMPLQKAR